jgi:hypothetical protein
MEQNMETWFETWMEENITEGVYPEDEEDADVKKYTAQCEKDATEAGFTRAEIEEAYDDTLENIITDYMIDLADEAEEQQEA